MSAWSGNLFLGRYANSESGRAQGLATLAKLTAKHLGPYTRLYGFDTFMGMPSTKVALLDQCREVWRPGGYGDTSYELAERRVPSAILIQGEFGQLLPLRTYGISRVRFARIDCDIYEGYRDALKLLTPCLQVGTYLLFDEGKSIPDPEHEQGIAASGERAIGEWKESTGIRLETVCELDNWTEILCRVEAL